MNSFRNLWRAPARRGTNRASTMHDRTRYYNRHVGLLPLSIVNNSLSDTNGLPLLEYASEGDLVITDININIHNNTRKHYTNKYDITKKMDPERNVQVPKLVVRRGYSFEITLLLNRPYKKGKDKVNIQLAFGKRPKIQEKTLVRLPIEPNGKPKQWKLNLKTVKANELTVELTSPPNCFVGIWRLSGHVIYMNSEAKVTASHEVYMLFNPFNKDDDVYMNDQVDREEYVMNESGVLFTGTYDTCNFKPWGYSQVNSPDDDGVVEGRWDGIYTDGTHPEIWQESAKILEQYWKTKKTVLYGQCWVFAGVLGTVCRAIGIPCRSVTNYCSAHDTDGSVSIDRFYNEYCEYEEFMNKDSVWNFHVWNEVYMTRPDLPVDGYNGWQVLDSTPQETSDGIYSCGPCPVAAVKKGDTTIKYDAPFIIAEVNADLISWLKQRNGSYKVINIETATIGQKIITKAVESMNAIDITLEYKFAEGSLAERQSINRAVLAADKEHDKAQIKDMEAQLVVADETALGTDFTVKLVIHNLGKETRTVNGNLSVMSVYYTGVIYSVLSNQPVRYVMTGRGEETVTSLIRYTDYAHKLVDRYNISVNCTMEVEETNQDMIFNKQYALKTPVLIIDIPDYVKKDVVLMFSVKFKNPLPVSLTGCLIYVDGPGLTLPRRLSHYRNVGANETFKTTVHIRPSALGWRMLLCNFYCDQIKGIAGSRQLNVVMS